MRLRFFSLFLLLGLAIAFSLYLFLSLVTRVGEQ